MKDFRRISVRHLTKSYGDKTAVDDFSLELGEGEFVTFLGPSGCGKSTALNCITGLVPISSGELWIDGELLDDGKRSVPPERREFGMVFQNYALFPHLTVKENVAFGLKLRKLSRAEVDRRVADAVRLVHLDGYERKFPSQMSGGEQQRVAIARCIVLEPRLLLLDEPLSNLDAKLRIELRYELKALHERLKVTTIYVTHDQTEALALSDRIVVLRLGRIQQIGTPEAIYSDPANPFVADFVGFKNAWRGEIAALAEAGERLRLELETRAGRLEAELAYPAGDPRRAGLVEAFERGSPVVTAVRPEDISLVPSGAGRNSLRCTARLVEYQGHSCQVSAGLEAEGAGAPGDSPERVDLRTAACVAAGESFTARVEPGKVLVFPLGEAAR